MTGELAIRDEQHYLATIAEVRALAERIPTVEGAKELADRARAAQVWAQRQRLGLEKVNLAAAAHLWAKHREGQLLVELRDGAKRLPNKTIGALNISLTESHEAQLLAEIDSEVFGELVDAMVPQGRITQAEVLRRAKRGERERRKAEEEADLVAVVNAAGGPTWELEVSDLRSFTPGEVDAIITDPPYITRDAVDLYAELGQFAVRTLKAGAPLVVMTWQPILPDVLQALALPELRYRWAVAWISGSNETTVDHQRRVQDRWKPVLVFHRGRWDQKAPILTDVVFSARDQTKGRHAWQQDLGGFRQLVRGVSAPGDTICDPFLGSGTTALAALAENRHFVGCDIDQAAVQIAQERLTA